MSIERASPEGYWGRGVSMVLLAILVFPCGIALAQEMPVPTEAQVALFLKILSYDRNLKPRASGEIILGILYQKKFKKSLNAQEEFTTALQREKPVPGDPPYRVRLLDASEGADLAEMISKQSMDVLYVTPMRAFDISAITKLSRSEKVTTITAVPEYVKTGIAIGVGLRGSKPQILINLPAARAEGSDFDSRLLNLATIIGDDREEP